MEFSHVSQNERVLNSGIQDICLLDGIRHRGICDELTADQFQYSNKSATTRTLQPGTELIVESTETEAFSIIVSGMVTLSKLMIDGRQQLVGFRFTPSLIGRPFGKENGSNAECATEVEVYSFPRHIMGRLITDNPALKSKLLHQALDELDEARAWMLALGRKNAGEKVASFLLFIAAGACPENEAETAVIDLPMSRSDIADFLWLTTETVSRELTKLRSHNAIQISNTRHITINDLSHLSARAGL